MEFHEGLMRLRIEEPSKRKSQTRRPKNEEKRIPEPETAGTRSRKWRLFQRSPPSSMASTPKVLSQRKEPPSEYICPITGSIMADPVIVTSGHSFERSSVEACKSHDFSPVMSDSSVADFSAVIPNLALKSSIDAWCKSNSGELPRPPDPAAVNRLVREYMASHSQPPSSEVSRAEEQSSSRETETAISPVSALSPSSKVSRTEEQSSSRETETAISPVSAFRLRRAGSNSSLSSIDTTATRTVTRLSPSEYSSASSTSSEIETTNPSCLFEEEDIVAKMKSQHIFEVEEGLITLRETTRSKVESRTYLCTNRLLATLQPLITEKYTGVQVNALAALVNLSLETSNKKKILRSGMLPPLIDVLKSGSLEAKEHAAGAIFSLALDDDIKTSIGALGALKPLMHLLRARSKRTRDESVMALIHLSRSRGNRSKLVKSGAVPELLHIVRSGWMTHRVLELLVNLSKGPEERMAMLSSGAVQCMVEILNREEEGSRLERELCVVVLSELSYVGLRFRVAAMKAGVVEALQKVEASVSERTKGRARAVMEVLTELKSEEEDVNWEEVLEKGFGSENGSHFSNETRRSTPNGSHFSNETRRSTPDPSF